jgi:SAM-dependent methyltransferase
MLRELDSYRKLCQEVYDLTKPKPPDFVWDFYLPYAQRVQGAILEPMCGSGRYMLSLLAEGFDVDGVDASPQMLAACRARCVAQGFKPNLYEQFLDELVLPRQYALAFIPAASFGLVKELEVVKRSLRGIYEALLPGGSFVLEIETVHNKPTNFGQWWGYAVDRPDGSLIVVSGFDRFYDEERQVGSSLIKYESVQAGRVVETEVETHDFRLYEPEQFEALLVEAGFEDVRCLKCWGEYAERPPDEDDPRVVFECRRPK